MYNTKKICPACRWSRTYDSNRDTFGVDSYTYCPRCGRRLKKVGYSPNI